MWSIHILTVAQELPQRKQVVTQARSRVLKETENPFGDDEDDEPSHQHSPPPTNASSSKPTAPGTQPTGIIDSFSYISSSKDKKKKDKDKKVRKSKPFNLEAEKEQLKTTIAESSMAATDLLNALQSINRERERISENRVTVQRFETCKLLRRKILRYVGPAQPPAMLLGNE